MSGTILVGAQWGDEGKGKISNVISRNASAVVRFQGGNNAGHTIYDNGNKIELRHLPSGILNPGVKSILASGMVLNLKSLIFEMNTIKEMGYKITKDNLFISNRAHLVLDIHQKIDEILEAKRSGANKIGTTKNGIGPAYVDKYSRNGIRFGDIFNYNYLNERILNLVKSHELILDINEEEQLELSQKLTIELFELGKELEEFKADTSFMIEQELKKDNKVIFESAQGVLLDVDFGTYPYVTSSNPIAPYAMTGSGVGWNNVTDVIGVIKAYNTRVGSGPFPTEFETEESEIIRERAHEYGVNTKRPRRIGWLDLVALSHSSRVSNINKIFINAMDVFSGFNEIKIATSYIVDGKETKLFPASDYEFENLEVNYETFAGWEEDISLVRDFNDLPENAKKYLNFIQEYLNIPLIGFSVGPKQEETNFLKED